MEKHTGAVNSLGERQDKLFGRKRFFLLLCISPGSWQFAHCTVGIFLLFMKWQLILWLDEPEDGSSAWHLEPLSFPSAPQDSGTPSAHSAFFVVSIWRVKKSTGKEIHLWKKIFVAFSAYKSFHLPCSLEVCCFVLCFKYLLFCLGLVYVAAVWWDGLGVSFQHHSDLQGSWTVLVCQDISFQKAL